VTAFHSDGRFEYILKRPILDDVHGGVHRSWLTMAGPSRVLHCGQSIVEQQSAFLREMRSTRALRVGQAPRTLVPARSVLDYVGAQLRQLRTARGMSQAGLAPLVFVHRDLVRKIEVAERIPSPEFLQRCDEVLETGGALARLSPLVERERLLHAAGASEVHATTFRSSDLDRPVLDWLLAVPTSSQGSGGDSDSSVGAAADLRQLRAMDHIRGAGAIYPTLERSLSGRLQDLAVTAPQVASGMLELAGYDAVDLGVDGVAQNHYLRALELMTRSANLLYGGYLVAVSLAHLALHCGDPDQAARLAAAGLRGTAGLATPAVRAAFRTVLARAHARRGDEAACAAALLQVDADLARSRADEEPDWIRYFGEADLADEKAHCFFDLGHYELAYQETQTALDLLPPDRARRISIDTALQAATLARAQDVERACVIARQAIDHATGMTSFRAAHRIVLMLGELYAYSDLPAVRDVVEYAHTRLPPVIPPD
jgi:transcriptional regulator with XRE-family HTH domain/tetratricopeptide (TPR) repeat protein